MTTFILAGGADKSHPEYMRSIAQCVAVKVDRPRILGVWFSGDEERADQKFPEFRDYLLEYFPDGTTYERAEKERFIQQVRDSEVIYFHGGSTAALIPAMQQYFDIEREFEGKIVIGSSAGAGYLADYYWSLSRSEVGRGRGILDVAIVNHYGSAGYADLSFEPAFWATAAEAVRAASGKEEVLLLPEGTCVIIER